MKHFAIFILVLLPIISNAQPDKGERKKARHERRLNREKFDNRSPRQKIKDGKVLSLIALAAIIVFRKVDESY